MNDMLRTRWMNIVDSLVHDQRSAKDFAILHAGYLADSVEHALKSNTLIMDADDWVELNTRVYEFRKRAMRATATDKSS
jgi:hypothetical protein